MSNRAAAASAASARCCALLCFLFSAYATHAPPARRSSGSSGNASLVSLVDVSIGTGGFGFGAAGIPPGPQFPFGAMRLSPDTTKQDEWFKFEHYGGYSYADDFIRCFSHTHMVGPGASDWGNIGVMPFRGEVLATVLEDYGYKSRFSHKQEVMSPGLYSVSLQDAATFAELTVAGTHAGIHRYTFENITASSSQSLLFDVCHSLTPRSEKPCQGGNVTIVPAAAAGQPTAVHGFVANHGGLSGRSQHGGAVNIYFYASVTSALTTPAVLSEYGTWLDGRVHKGETFAANPSDQSLGAFLTLSPPTDGASDALPSPPSLEVTVSVGISFVSAANAKNNLVAQFAPAAITDFDQVKSKAQAVWEAALGVVEVPNLQAADAGHVTQLYSAVYRTLLSPTTYSEADGRYRGFDDGIHSLNEEEGGGQQRKGEAGGWRASEPSKGYYSDMSIWDTHRSQFPWLLLYDSQVSRDIVRSLQLMTQQGTGDVPRWPLANVYTQCMIGNHATVIFADNIAKGVTDFDVASLYAASFKDATLPGRQHSGREAVENYTALGFVPFELCETAASNTLAYAFDDWAMSALARYLNKTVDAQRFIGQASNYKRLFDAESTWMCPSYANGTLACPTDVEALAFYPLAKKYIEGDAWQWVWFVPHDPMGLAALFPSTQAFVAKLDKFFNASLPWPNTDLPDPYYWAGNEPDILAPWLFCFAGRPDLTQKWTRVILDVFYGAWPGGVPGNDDFGTLTAWQLFAMLGFYPQSGGPTYMIGSPVLPEVILHRAEGDVTIKAYNASQTNIYVSKFLANGVEVPLTTVPFTFDHRVIAKEATLEFWMQSSPP